MRFQIGETVWTTKTCDCAEREKYNGWTNRETWATHLWLTNDEFTYSSARQVVGTEFEFEFMRAEALEDFVGDILNGEHIYSDQDQVNAMASDIGSLWRVNWREIVEALRED